MIIAYANEGTLESMTPTSRALHNAAIAVFSIFGFIAFMFLLLACQIRCDGLKEKFVGSKVCPKNMTLVFPMLLLSCIMMLLMDTFMFIYTTVNGSQQGEKVIDFSSFGDGFRSCMFFLSIFDMTHASVGIAVIILSRKKVLNKVIPEESTGTYLERERYKLNKDMEYYKSGQFAKDFEKEMMDYLDKR